MMDTEDVHAESGYPKKMYMTLSKKISTVADQDTAPDVMQNIASIIARSSILLRSHVNIPAVDKKKNVSCHALSYVREVVQYAGVPVTSNLRERLQDHEND